MMTLVIAITVVVKKVSDDARCRQRAHWSHGRARPREWDKGWQVRLVWMVEHVVPKEMSMRELYRRAKRAEGVELEPGKDGALAGQIDRLRNGGDLHVSTLIGLQSVLGFSWEWLLDNRGWPTEEIRKRMSGSAPPIRAV